MPTAPHHTGASAPIMTRAPQLVAFPRRTGLGFCGVSRDQPADPDSVDNKAEGLDIGPVGSLELDLDF